jgi:hypothetical protein
VGKVPALPDSALEFCLLVNGKEKLLDYGMLDAARRDELVAIVGEYSTPRGVTAELERRARAFLFDYRVLANGVLDTRELHQLDEILETEQPTLSQHPTRTRKTIEWPRPNRRGIILLVAALCVALIAIIIAVSVNSGSSAPPAQPGTSGQHQITQVVPPGDTPVQQLVQKYGLTHQITPSAEFPQTGAPGLLLLESGNYYVSETWTIPANQPNWQPDESDLVPGIQMQGQYAVIQDQNDNQYVVKIDQPFVFADDPYHVIRIDSTGHALVLDLAFAKSVRY